MRIQNLTGQETCRHCEPGKTGPSGLILVATRQGTDEYGPCPHCEAGERAEAKLTQHGFPRYPDGFWQGRPTPKPVRRETELPTFENMARMRLLTERFFGRDVDPSIVIDLPDTSRRMEFVERELAKVAQRPPADVPSAP